MGNTLINLTGLRFGKLHVIGKRPNAHITPNGSHKVVWNCLCDCGTACATVGQRLRRGETTSCGCVQKAQLGEASRTHDMSGTDVFNIYHGAKSRCQNPTSQAYRRYGGRGIEFCFSSLKQFADELGERPSPSHSVDRRNNDGHYEPGNIHWATREEQAQNQDHTVRAARMKKMALKAPPHTMTGFKGVQKHASKYRARIRVNNVLMILGTCSTPEEAAMLYDEAALVYFGSDAFLNFSSSRSVRKPPVRDVLETSGYNVA